MANEAKRVGFIGLGLMGTPMAKRLLDEGFSLTVWNRSTDKSDCLVEAGASCAESIVDLVDQSDVIMLCVSDTAAVEAVVFGVDGVIHAKTEGKILVDFSSIEPEKTRHFAARLLADHSAHWVDAPVSGGVPGAQQGTLAIMAGGEENIVDSVRGVLACLSQRVTYMGPSGCGQVTKLCNQMIVGCNVLMIAEMMGLAEAAGVDSAKIPEALKGGFADSTPLQLVGPRIADKYFEKPQWTVKTLLKDLDTALLTATNNHAALPLSELAASLMRQHGELGNMDGDPATLVNYFKHLMEEGESDA